MVVEQTWSNKAVKYVKIISSLPEKKLIYFTVRVSVDTSRVSHLHLVPVGTALIKMWRDFIEISAISYHNLKIRLDQIKN